MDLEREGGEGIRALSWGGGGLYRLVLYVWVAVHLCSFFWGCGVS